MSGHYAIDPAWYGMLPRSYLYDADRERVLSRGTGEIPNPGLTVIGAVLIYLGEKGVEK